MTKLLLTTLSLSLLLLNIASAQTDVQLYLSADVAAVGYVDISKLDLAAGVTWLNELGLISSDEQTELGSAVEGYQKTLAKLTNLDIQRVFFLVRTSDVSQRGPTWIMPLGENVDAQTVQHLLKFDGLLSKWVPQHWQTDSRNTLVGGYDERQEQAQASAQPTTRPEFADAWSALGKGTCGIIVLGTSDNRRVVREMLPPLPVPFDKVDGTLLADGVRWMGASVNFPPVSSVNIEIETADSNTAERIGETISGGWQQLAKADIVTQSLDSSASKLFFAALAPHVSGSRVSISPTAITENAQRLTQVLAPPIHRIREAAERRERIDQFKNIALAIHNYAAVKKEVLPTQSIYDTSGKPLLSWRVLILPYLEQGKLYNQFHLDEPWDSEHNRSLIAKMPTVYADPDPALRKLNAAGRTTFVLPTGPETLYDSSEPNSLKDITDGLSNTIMVVEVAPENAVNWTKPADWEVDLGDPWRGVRRSDREWFTTAFWDGSARIIDNSVDDEKLKALITPAGEEVIEW